MAVVVSPYVGNARGKLGEGVFYRAKGNTIVRGYNPAPQNRRTVSQQTQRAVFSSAVKFYSRGVQNLFQFAFENKKTTESDYNAFMRYNSQMGMYFGPEQNQNDFYPAIGEWVLSRGSLGNIRTLMVDDSKIVARLYSNWQSSQEPTTWGQVSELLVGLGFAQGDFLTWLGINTNDLPSSEGEPIEDAIDEPIWTIKQVQIDVSSSADPEDLGVFVTFTPSQLDLSMDVGLDDGTICGGSIVWSRVVNGSVRVSNSQLQLNALGKLALQYGRSDTWLAIVMEAWNTEQIAILQGSLSQAQRAVQQVQIYVPWTYPCSTDAITAGSMLISEPVSLNDIAEHLRFSIEDLSGQTASVEGEEVQFRFTGASGYIMVVHLVLNGQTIISIELMGDFPDSTVNGIQWV